MLSRPWRALRVALRLCLTGLLMTTLLVTAAGTASAAPPSNDDRANAIELDGPLPITVEGDTSEATSAEGDPYDDCNWEGLYGTVWYSYTPPEDQRLVMSVTSESGLVAAAYRFSDDGSIVSQTCPSARQLVDFEAGATYYLLVAHHGWTSGGPFTLTLDEAPPPVEADVRITSVLYDRDSAIAHVNGTVTCSEDAQFWGDGFLRQARQRPPVVVQADFYVNTIDCSTSPASWSAEVFPSRPLRIATAYVRFNFAACDGLTCDSRTVARTLRVARADLPR